MQKEQVGMIEVSVQIKEEDALFVRFFRDGTVVREGGGGLPPVGIMGQYRLPHNKPFEQYLAVLPEEIVQKPVIWHDEGAVVPIDYKVLCYGGNLNGGIGMEAEWGATCGLRVAFDINNPPKSPLLSLADKLVNLSKSMTNGTYFDCVIEAVFRKHSSALPDNALIDVIQDDAEWLSKALARLAIQYTGIGRVQLTDMSKGKVYTDKMGKKWMFTMFFRESKLTYRFDPA